MWWVFVCFKSGKGIIKYSIRLNKICKSHMLVICLCKVKNYSSLIPFEINYWTFPWDYIEYVTTFYSRYSEPWNHSEIKFKYNASHLREIWLSGREINWILFFSFRIRSLLLIIALVFDNEPKYDIPATAMFEHVVLISQKIC